MIEALHRAGPLRGGQGQPRPPGAGPLRRPAAAALHRPLAGGPARGAAARRAVLGARPDLDRRRSRRRSSPLRSEIAIVIVTHNLQQAQRVADHVGFMYLGDLVEYGGAEQVFGAPRGRAHPRVRQRRLRVSAPPAPGGRSGAARRRAALTACQSTQGTSAELAEKGSKTVLNEEGASTVTKESTDVKVDLDGRALRRRTAAPSSSSCTTTPTRAWSTCRSPSTCSTRRASSVYRNDAPGARAGAGGGALHPRQRRRDLGQRPGAGDRASRCRRR